MLERRVRGNSYARCEAGEKPETSDTVGLPIAIYTRGEDFVTFNEKQLHVKPGYITLLPKVTVSNYFVDRISSSCFVDIFFDTNSLMPTEILTFDLSRNKQIGTLFDKIYTIWIMRNHTSCLNCFSLFYQILSEMSQTLFKPLYSNANIHEKIKPGIEYIYRHCFNPEFNYNEMARVCGVSYSYFKRIFISVYQMPPSKYINYIKMEHAKEMLETGKYNVNTVAGMIGYVDAAYFSRVFKDYTGCAPIEFLKN